MNKIWYLSITSWRGSIGAEHWYGALTGPSGRWRINHLMTEDEAARLTAKDGGFISYAGEGTNRFDLKDEVISAAIALFESMAAPGDVLVRGEISVSGPYRPLAGPPEVLAEMQEYFDKAEEIGWYGEPRDRWSEMDNLGDEWRCWADVRFERYDRERSEDDVFVRRVDGGWEVAEAEDYTAMYAAEGAPTTLETPERFR